MERELRPRHRERARLEHLQYLLGANLLLYAVIVIGRRLILARWEGSVLVASYVAYLAAVIARMQ
jgi:hypothetical protein